MSHEYSEDVLVQEAAANLLQELGWEVKYAYNTEKLGERGSFGRESHREVLLTRYFRRALKKLNPWLTTRQMDEAQSQMESYLATASLLQTNAEKYRLIRDGIPVTVQKANGQTEEKRAQVLDFQQPADQQRNHFLAIRELYIRGTSLRRPDIVGFVNGIPLLFVELKNYNVAVQNAYDENYTDYLDTIPHLFFYNAFVILSNGTEAKIGTLGSKYEFFHDWKRLAESDAGSVALETMLRGICQKENFLDLLENFILYDRSAGDMVKIFAHNHQYLGVNEAVKAYAERKLRAGKLGVFWHTQGSGKSYSMVFLAAKIRRKFLGSPTIIILTDRDELNRQIAATFAGCGLLGEGKAAQFMATSGDDLVTKLKGNPSFIFTLIQKFNQPNAEPFYPQHDILIMSDEAHRSQYGIYADNMCRLLPTAARIGFTGTPLLADDNITERTFGGYISVYDFQRAVQDGATVPLYYENRGEKIAEIHNPQLNEEILAAIENADLKPDQQERLEREFAKEIHILTAQPRLESIARDFVNHYSDLWTSGKAMFVCLNKVTCVRMYNLVQQYWQERLAELEEEQLELSQQEAQELGRKIKWMRETEMCVVISSEQNERQMFQKWGLDISPHREKMEKRELDKEFKDAANTFRVVFVCAMWLTGFDVKCLACPYLDKPLKAHTLMQAIARANRVCEGKSNGLIIDYIGIVKALRRALADYTADGENGGEGTSPTIDKERLIERIYELLAAATDFLARYGFALQNLVEAERGSFRRMELLQDAVNAMCESVQIKKQFQTYASELARLVKYADRDDVDAEAIARKNAIMAIYEGMQPKRRHVDNTDLMAQINSIVNDYVVMEGHSPYEENSKRFDISGIDFDILRREFAKRNHKNLLLRDLEELVEMRLHQFVADNPKRMDYLLRYREIIKSYNKEQDRATIEKTFMELMELVKGMNEEQQRYVREGFASDEELTLYDLLFAADLSEQDIRAIKKLAVELLAKIKAEIATMDHWTDKVETKSQIYVLIRDTMFYGLPACYDEVSMNRCQQNIFNYVCDRYGDRVLRKD